MDSARYITPDGARQALRKLHAEDAETNPELALRAALADDLKPVDARGRWKPSSSVILVGAIGCALLAVFLYFSLGRNL